MNVLKKNRLFFSICWRFLIASLVPLLLLGIITYNMFSSALQTNIRNELIAISDHRTEVLQNKCRSFATFITERATGPTLITAFKRFNTSFVTDGPQSKTYNEIDMHYKKIFKKYFYANSDFYDLLFISRKGDVVFSILHEDDFAINVLQEKMKKNSLTDVFRTVTMTLSTAFSDFAYYPPSRQPALFVGTPVFSSDGFLGVLVIQVTPEMIYEFTSDYTGMSATGDIVMGTASGDTITYIAPTRFMPDAAFKMKNIIKDKNKPIWRAIHGETGIGLAKDYRDKNILARWQYIPLLHCGMVVKEDEDEVFSVLRMLRKTTWKIIIVMVLGIILTVVSVTRTILIPVMALKKQSELISNGEPGLEINIGVDNEIGDLTVSFNMMREQILQFREQMEILVADKTDKLSVALKDSETSRKEILQLMDEMREVNSELDKFSRAVEQSPVTIIITDKSGIIEYVNPRFENITGYSREDAIGQNPRILKSGLHPDELYKELWDTLLSGREWHGSLCNKKKNGELYWELCSLSPVKDINGEITHFIGVKEDITDRKRMEKELLDEKTLTDAIINTLPGVFYLYENGKRLVRWNKNHEIVTGYSGSECYGKKPSDFFKPEIRPVVDMTVKEVMNKGVVTAEIELFNVKTDVTAPYLFNAVKISVGSKDYLLGTGMDLSEIKKAEASIRESEKRFRIMFDESPDAYLILNALDGKVLSCNKASEKLLEGGSEEIIGKTPDQLSPRYQPDGVLSSEAVKPILAVVLATGKHRFEWVHTTFSGKEFWAEVSIAVMEFENRKVHFTSLRNITELVKLRNEQQATLIQTNKLIDSSPYGMCLYNKDGQCVRANKAATDIIGGTEDQLLRQNYNTISSWKKSGLYDQAQKTLNSGLVFANEMPITTTFNKQIFINIQTLKLMVAGEPHLLVNFVDISDFIRIQRQLESSNKELEQFAYVASHDMQEPLRVVVSYLQFLESQYSEKLDEKGIGYIVRAVGATKRMSAMIKSLLAYSRISTRGKKFEPCNTRAIVDDALEDLNKVIEKKEAVVRIGILHPVSGDKDQIRRLFQNLIGNAIKFCHEHPEIEITSKREKMNVVFSVKDNGIGIDSNYFDRIFVIFQRLHTRSKYEGTGIGLSACKKIVERHGGKIWVESEPGKGATFFFTLTAVDENATKLNHDNNEKIQ